MTDGVEGGGGEGVVIVVVVVDVATADDDDDDDDSGPLLEGNAVFVIIAGKKYHSHVSRAFRAR